MLEKVGINAKWTGEQAPPPLPSSIRNGRSASCAKRTSGPPLLIGLTTACFRHRRRPSCAPYQFPLKSYGFSGAETARKRFLLWKIEFPTQKSPRPRRTRRRGRLNRERALVPQFAIVALRRYACAISTRKEYAHVRHLENHRASLGGFRRGELKKYLRMMMPLGKSPSLTAALRQTACASA